VTITISDKNRPFMSKASPTHLVCGACNYLLGELIDFQGSTRVLGIRKWYALNAEGIWKVDTGKKKALLRGMYHEGRLRIARQVSGKPLRIECVRCGSVQFPNAEALDINVFPKEEA
jgi:hypothetical protein